MASHGTGKGPGRVGERISRTGTRFCAAKAHRREPPVAPRRKASYPHSASIPKPGMVLPQSITMRQGASLARFPLRRLWRKTRNWENTTGCGVASDLPAVSAFVFKWHCHRLLKHEGAGHPLSRPRHLPNGYSFPDGHPVKQAPTALFPSNPSFPARRSPSVIKMGIFDRQKYDFFLFIAFPLTPERGVW